MRSFKKFVESKKIVEYVFVPALYKGKWAVLDTVSQVYYDVKGGKDAAEKKCNELNDIHHNAPVKLDPLEEAEYNDAWWNSKSDNFKKRYIERHPNSIYAQKANTSSSDDESPAMRAAKAASNLMNRLNIKIGDKKNNVSTERKTDDVESNKSFKSVLKKAGIKPQDSDAVLSGEMKVSPEVFNAVIQNNINRAHQFLAPSDPQGELSSVDSYYLIGNDKVDSKVRKNYYDSMVNDIKINGGDSDVFERIEYALETVKDNNVKSNLKNIQKEFKDLAKKVKPSSGNYKSKHNDNLVDWYQENFPIYTNVKRVKLPGAKDPNHWADIGGRYVYRPNPDALINNSIENNSASIIPNADGTFGVDSYTNNLQSHMKSKRFKTLDSAVKYVEILKSME